MHRHKIAFVILKLDDYIYMFFLKNVKKEIDCHQYHLDVKSCHKSFHFHNCQKTCASFPNHTIAKYQSQLCI